MTDTVLLVEDEGAMREFLHETLGAHGYIVAAAATAARGLELASAVKPRAILLDLGLPDDDGLSLLRQLRTWSTTPVIVLSARQREDEKIEALDSGANDYLTKPFGIGELLARIRVALRLANDKREEPVTAIGPIRIDHVRREVTVDSDPVHLTPIEFRLLSMLARSAGRVLTHEDMLCEIWGAGHGRPTHLLRVHMATLRRKVDRGNGIAPRWIVTESGIGYRLRDQ
jgi:two-component system, OmpR family, KDP operon response regulator KdpE